MKFIRQAVNWLQVIFLFDESLGGPAIDVTLYEGEGVFSMVIFFYHCLAVGVAVDHWIWIGSNHVASIYQ